MGCGTSKPRSKPKMDEDDAPSIESINVPDWEASYPTPFPPSTGKEEIFDKGKYLSKDKRVSKMTGSPLDTYESLLGALCAGCDTDIDKARAIFVWLFRKDINTVNYYGVDDPHTPIGYMKLIKAGRGTLEAFFAILCRAVGIPCAILCGIGKGDNYKVGQTTTADIETSWTAVYIHNSWRLVHLDWAFYHTDRLSAAGIEREHNGPTRAKRSSINEFFWLTDPAKFVTFCFPNDCAWQLVDCPWDQCTFLEYPQLTEEYFTSGFQLSPGCKANITGKNGICSVQFNKSNTTTTTAITNNNSKTKEDTQTIRLKGTLKKENHDLFVKEYDAYIISTATESSGELWVRFPDKGVFYLTVSGGDHQDDLSVVAKFRLECAHVVKPVSPFPLQPENGFTILPTMRNFGISAIEPKDNVVIVKSRSIKEFHLSLSRNDIDLQAEMCHANRNSESLRSCLEVVTDTSAGQAKVKVTIPEETHLEYALQLSACDSKSSRKSKQPFATFLLVHSDWPYPAGRARKANLTDEANEIRRDLQEATQAGNSHRLEVAINGFKASGLEDAGDLTKALNVLRRMHLDNLTTATETRDFKTVVNTITKAERSCLADVLEQTEEMKEARRVQRQLLRLKIILHKVLELKPKTISEIHSYPRPRNLVHIVMKATFRILGEPKENVESWQSVKNLTRQIGANGIINRIKRFDIILLSPQEVQDAEQYLDKTNRCAVRVVSAGAAAFFLWSKEILTQYQTMAQEERNRSLYSSSVSIAIHI